MRVEVAYALPGRQWLRAIDISPGATAAEAVRASGLIEEIPGIDPAATPLGIFGQRCAPDRVLRAGDRVEVYRPLQVDPKEARRLGAHRGRF